MLEMGRSCSSRTGARTHARSHARTAERERPRGNSDGPLEWQRLSVANDRSSRVSGNAHWLCPMQWSLNYQICGVSLVCLPSAVSCQDSGLRWGFEALLSPKPWVNDDRGRHLTSSQLWAESGASSEVMCAHFHARLRWCIYRSVASGLRPRVLHGWSIP